MQQKLIFTLLAMLIINAYGASSDTAQWPVVGKGINSSIFHLHDPHNGGVLFTLWVSAYCTKPDQVAFAHQLLMHLDNADSIHTAVGNALDRNKQIVHAQLDMCVDGYERLRAWGWVQGNEIFTKVDTK
jgi:hypothetical protein